MKEFFDFIKNGGLFGMMRGFDSSKEGHPYSFDEFSEDITKCSNCVRKTAEIPSIARRSLSTGSNEKQNRIESYVSANRRIGQ